MVDLKEYNLTPEEMAKAAIDSFEARLMTLEQEKVFSIIRNWDNPEMIRLGEDLVKAAIQPIEDEVPQEAIDALAGFVSNLILEDAKPESLEN